MFMVTVVFSGFCPGLGVAADADADAEGDERGGGGGGLRSGVTFRADDGARAGCASTSARLRFGGGDLEDMASSTIPEGRLACLRGGASAGTSRRDDEARSWEATRRDGAGRVVKPSADPPGRDALPARSSEGGSAGIGKRQAGRSVEWGK